jgi:hypothetical protein
VRIVSNILTECGLFNGAMGTVWGFVYKGQGPQTEEERVPQRFDVLEDYQRELPIVLVRMDGTDEQFPFSCYNDTTRIVPLIAVCNKSRINGSDKTRKFCRYQKLHTLELVTVFKVTLRTTVL